jgi:GTPase
MLVVSGSAGIVGMTHEHLALAIALDVPFFITITKTDVKSPADTLLSLEAMLKSAGCRKVMKSIKNLNLCTTAHTPSQA